MEVNKVEKVSIGGVMYYPDDFKQKAKELYPSYYLLHESLDRGEARVGELLTTAWSKGIAFDVILKATSLEEIQKKARLGIERQKLYSEWLDRFGGEAKLKKLPGKELKSDEEGIVI